MLFSDVLPPHLIFSELPGCECHGSCNDPLRCACLARSGGLNYIPDTRFLRQSSFIKDRAIYECNSSCSCDNFKCTNRLVQHLLEDSGPLQEMKTSVGKGRGVSATRRIRTGEFVCIYRGLYIRPDEAESTCAKQAAAWSHVYVLVVREFAGEKMVFETVIDGACDGCERLPLSSLINHSCEPNLTVVPVRVDSLLPLLAFFARVDIEEDEEVAYDYGEQSGGHVSLKPCLCGSTKCRGFLPNHS